jgi:hypothetical protein
MKFATKKIRVNGSSRRSRNDHPPGGVACGLQAALYFKYRTIFRNPYMSRGLNITPQPLTEMAVSSAKGITLSDFGRHFESTV